MLAFVRPARSSPLPQALAESAPPEGLPFTVTDRMALTVWPHIGTSGYGRLVIEEGEAGSNAFALIYRHNDVWAAWGLARVSAGVMAWRCANGVTLGVFPTMQAALAALPAA